MSDRGLTHLDPLGRARMVDVTPLPKAPPIVRGLVNVHGQVIPVVDTRRRFRMSDKDVSLGDQLPGGSSRQVGRVRFLE